MCLTRQKVADVDMQVSAAIVSYAYINVEYLLKWHFMVPVIVIHVWCIAALVPCVVRTAPDLAIHW